MMLMIFLRQFHISDSVAGLSGKMEADMTLYQSINIGIKTSCPGWLR
jgi:hypothetical protein